MSVKKEFNTFKIFEHIDVARKEMKKYINEGDFSSNRVFSDISNGGIMREYLSSRHEWYVYGSVIIYRIHKALSLEEIERYEEHKLISREYDYRDLIPF